MKGEESNLGKNTKFYNTSSSSSTASLRFLPWLEMKNSPGGILFERKPGS
jgi:hypothetical protein